GSIPVPFHPFISFPRSRRRSTGSDSAKTLSQTVVRGTVSRADSPVSYRYQSSIPATVPCCVSSRLAGQPCRVVGQWAFWPKSRDGQTEIALMHRVRVVNALGPVGPSGGSDCQVAR